LEGRKEKKQWQIKYMIPFAAWISIPLQPQGLPSIRDRPIIFVPPVARSPSIRTRRNISVKLKNTRITIKTLDSLLCKLPIGK